MIQPSSIIEPGQDAPMGKRIGPRRTAPSRPLRRVGALIEQLEQSGISQSEMSRRTGIPQSHVNKLRNYRSSGRTSVGAEIVGEFIEWLKLDPWFFHDNSYDDEADGVRDYRLYLLSAKRDERRLAALEEAVANLQQLLVSTNTSKAVQEAELMRLRNEVVHGQGAAAKTRR